jgi:hypothetical protein
MSYSNNTITNSKPCNYGCNIKIYWNASENVYEEEVYVYDNRTTNITNLLYLFVHQKLFNNNSYELFYKI